MNTPATAYIGLGSNLGERADFINKALKALADNPHIEVDAVSDQIETAPLADKTQPAYLNATARVNTTLTPEKLYETMTTIETELGRVRGEKWAPRQIDLDLLLFGSEIINLPHLTVPHPQMHLRSFVLKGLCQLDPELIHPLMGESVSELASRLGGSDFFLDDGIPQLISTAGTIGVGKTTLIKNLANYLDSTLIFEQYEKNPFLPKVYAGQKQFALDSQLYFLNSRIEQLNPQLLKETQLVISDYVFQKELIYAKLLLDSTQLASYERSYNSVADKVVGPVLVLYLTDSPKNCLQRIKSRSRPYEQKIDEQFLQKLSTAYQKLFENWKTSPVIRLSMSEFDTTRDTDIQYLANQIKYYIATK